MSKTIREAYGEALVEFGKDNPDVVVLDADVSSSTKTSVFKTACPERFFNIGIAEANMTAIAAGMASTGKIPFVNTFAVFLTSLGLISARSLGSYNKLPIKLVGAYGGLSDSYDGPSHHSIDDIATMRALPNFKVYVASDNSQTRWLVNHAIKDQNPIYIRLSRDIFPDLYTHETIFQDGKGKVLRYGKDAFIIASGYMVHQAVLAADMLLCEGLNIGVIDMFCIKPIDRELILSCADYSGAIVTAEEHSILGGLGSAVAEVLCEGSANVTVRYVGIRDCHSECGPYKELLDKYGLNVTAIISALHEVIDTKR